jgi:hypothetical protein
MGNINYHLHKRREALRCLEKLNNNASHLFIIHYSCESFYDIEEGRTPRITSIAVRSMNNFQTQSFSIHKVAEKKGITISEIDNHYDVLEKEMLLEYFEFVKQYRHYEWLHWNMRDINYGFEAIEHRFKVLKGSPESIEAIRKHDMARLIMDIYGVNYIAHPRMEKLIDKNDISKRGFLNGAEEAEAFKNKDFVKLHQSTLRKVEVLDTIFDRILNHSLKTDGTLFDIYGLSPQGIFNLIKNNWLFHLITAALWLIIGAALGAWFTRMFG